MNRGDKQAVFDAIGKYTENEYESKKIVKAIIDAGFRISSWWESELTWDGGYTPIHFKDEDFECIHPEDNRKKGSYFLWCRDCGANLGMHDEFANLEDGPHGRRQ